MGETEGELGLVLMGRSMLSKSLVQFSFDGWGCVLSLLFDLRPNYGGGNEDNCDLLQKVPCMHCNTQCPQPCSGPPPTHTSAGGSLTHGRVWVSLLWDHSSFLLGPGANKLLFVLSKILFPSLCKFWPLYDVVIGDHLQEGLCHTQVYCTQSP